MICWEPSFPSPDRGPLDYTRQNRGLRLRLCVSPWPTLASAHHPLHLHLLWSIWRRERQVPTPGEMEPHLLFTLKKDPLVGGKTKARWDMTSLYEQKFPGLPLNYSEFCNKFNHVTPIKSNYSHYKIRVYFAFQRFMSF